MNDDVRFRLLGPVRIQRAGNEHPLGSGRRAACLAVLALTSGASRDDLVSAVWGDNPPASANGNVYTHVNALRNALGDGLLTRENGVYRLRATEQTVDVLRFEALREQARRYRAAGNLFAELASLNDGLGLWDGAALEGLPGPFAEAQRARLHELRLAGEQRRAEVLVELGRPGEAVDALRELVAAHPLQESPHRLLMAALDAAGRPEEALGVYEDLNNSLVLDSGIEPTADLRRIREHIAIGSGSWPPRLRDVLRAVVFLGANATIEELCQATGLPRSAVAQEIDAARAGGVLTIAAGRVEFHDPTVARALYNSTPEALRAALHGFFAEMIADSFGPPQRVAAQLLRAEPAPLTPAASRWLLEHSSQLALGSPDAAIALLRRAHLQYLPDHEVHVALSVWLARLLYGRGEDAVPEAGWVAARTDDPDVQAEMLWIAASSHDRQDRPSAAADIARSTLSSRRYPEPWLGRFRNLILRLRLSLPGQPTEPRHGRAAVLNEHEISAYRRSVASDGPR